MTETIDEIRNLGQAAEWLACLTPSGRPPARITVADWRKRGVKCGRRVIRLKTVPVGTYGTGVRKSDAEEFVRAVTDARK